MPYKLARCGVGGAEVAAELLDAFDALVAQGQTVDPITARFLQVGSPLRPHWIAHVHGDGLSAELEAALREYVWLNLDESRAEG
eukprot:3950447-Lingulodinium_polyedra.AAC.1